MSEKTPPSLKIGLEIAGLALLIAFIITLWYYRDEAFRTLNDPGEPFQTYSPPLTPDYASPASWLALPDLSLDTELTQGDADIFVVAPTIFTGGTGWNADIQDAALRQEFARIVVPNYITPYKIGGRVFAPAYRQAALYTFLTTREDARRAQDFAYQDVHRAFNAFLTHNRPERPIVLIGHGQGGLHVQRLLSDYFYGERTQQLAVAYVIDHPVLATTLPQNIPVCETEEQTGCLVSFGAFMPSDNVAAKDYVTKMMVFEQGRLQAVNGRELICVNPLLWNTSTDYAPARLHKGGVAGEGLGPDTVPASAPRQAGAQCEDGVLLVDKPKQSSLRRPYRFGGRYRTLPSNLFYEDLRQNMVTRIEALLATNTLPKRAPIMDDITEEIIDTPVVLPEE